MFSVRSKRPSSARRNIKQETFSPFVSATRLRHVQSLLQDGTRDTKDFPDAILCISGIDSRYNDGMIELINYLMFGFFDLRKAELEKSGFDEEVIDDILFLIQRDQVDVYCNPINYHYLLPYVSHWRNVFFHCLTESEYEDEERAEEFKISTFVSLVKDCQKIGIPYSNSACPQEFDKFAIEKWPLIQVYGVEGVGSGGFFTMQHDVEDISSQVHKIYNNMDPVALENMIVEQLSRLERQWRTMISTVDVDLSSSPEVVTEEKVCEPLKSFYVHGCVGGNGDGPNTHQPYVLFGLNTRKEKMVPLQRVGNSHNDNLKSTAIGNNGSNIMVCKAVSPRGPLQCARTYFFHKDFVNPFQDAKITSYEQNKDLRLLTIMYSAMIDGVVAGIDVYSNTLSVSKAKTVAEETVFSKCSAIMDNTISQYLKNKSHTGFSIESIDNHGRCENLSDGQRCLLVKYVTMTMYDIPSVEKNGQTLGSLMFSESFLDSVLRVKGEESGVHIHGNYLLLTDHIPRHQAWAWSSQEENRKLLENKLEGDSLGSNFGKLLLSGDTVNIGCSSRLSYPPDEVSLYAYENGLVLLNPHSGAIVLHGNHIKSVTFYDGDSYNTVAVLVLEYQPTLVPYVPFHLQTEECQLVLLFRPKSKAHKHLYSEVLHNWKEDSNMPKVQSVEELPPVAADLHSLLQHHFSTEASTKVKTSLQTATVNLPHFYSFLDHYTASSVGWDPVRERDLNSILNQTTDFTDTDLPEMEIIVTIISGIPGCHQDKLVDVLSDLSKDQNRYVVLKPPLDGTQMFNPADLQTKLKATLNVHRRRKQTQTMTKNTRVIYVVPGYSDIVSVVQAVECHPDPDVRKHCFIGSVTACVDPLNSFMEHKYTFPLLLNLCAQGWVNQIVMTSSTDLKNEHLDDLQHMIRSVNSDVSFLLAEQGQIKRSMDIEAVLSENSYSQREKVRARHLICPGWSTKPYKPIKSSMEMKQLRFSLPLDKNKLLQNLKGLKSSLVPYPFSGNIYNIQGKVSFVGETDLKELHYTTMNSSLSIQPYTEVTKDRTSAAGNFVTFTGVHLEEAKSKDWLRNCAPQKPEKRKLVTRKDVTRDEIKKLHKEHHLEPLPAGWFYNGTQFVSFDGSKQDQHPNLEEFIADYVEKKNVIIRAFNQKIEDMTNSFKDLFA